MILFRADILGEYGPFLDVSAPRGSRVSRVRNMHGWALSYIHTPHLGHTIRAVTGITLSKGFRNEALGEEHRGLCGWRGRIRILDEQVPLPLWKRDWKRNVSTCAGNFFG